MSAPPPPQVSPDGKFYWDGQRWVPMQAAQPQLQSASPYPNPLLVYGPGTNSFAVASLIAGIAGWLCCPVAAAVVAVICGHVARNQIRRTGEGGRGMATAGLILGWVQVGVVGVFVVLEVIGLLITAASGTHS